MKRRITAAIVGVTALVLIVLTIPLAMVARRSLINDELLRLQSTAAHTLSEIAVPFDADDLAALESEPDAPPPFTAYHLDGTRLFGEGPEIGDEAVYRALAGTTESSTSGREAIVTLPILEPETERVVGALRVTRSLSTADRNTALALGVIVLIGSISVALAWFVARRVADRLSSPLEHLADAAGSIGDGESVLEHRRTGITEIDQLGESLARTSRRMNETIVRERQFSADVSHQLRTPLTGLRLKVEALSRDRDPIDAAAVEDALADLDRIERTVDHLLQYARDAMPASPTASLSEALHRARERWTEPARRAERPLEIVRGVDVLVRGSPASIDQILDVLINNALSHGSGSIDVTARSLAGGGAIDVRDAGSTAAISDDDLFRRGQGVGHGIGLSFARSLAEADAGRLIRTQMNPTTISLMLLEVDHELLPAVPPLSGRRSVT